MAILSVEEGLTSVLLKGACTRVVLKGVYFSRHLIGDSMTAKVRHVIARHNDDDVSVDFYPSQTRIFHGQLHSRHGDVSVKLNVEPQDDDGMPTCLSNSQVRVTA